MKYLLCLFLYYLIGTIYCDRISRRLFPIKYDLTLTPYFETETDSNFESRLVFTFKPLRHYSVQTLALHADGLETQSVVLIEYNNNGSKQLGIDISDDNETQLMNIDTGYPLSVDNTYELRVNYTGRITDDGWGLYKGSYQHEGKSRSYIVTQLRPVFARRLLPCLDEPSYKARFTLRVWRLPQYTARSNMPLVDTSPTNLATGRVLDTFAETPPMSTFLLALAVFDFSSLSSADKRFYTWTVPAKIQLAHHGHNMLPAIVSSMEAVVGSVLPMPKLDQIALPQLNPVAMENWGISTYREVFMLYKEGMFAPRVRQDVPRFTGHEVAHHWLGNLVTIEWWDWLWISEMYAMYYEYYLPSLVEPTWRMADQMVVDLSVPGLRDDSLSSSTPLTTNVSTNQQILAKFSGVVYTKGPCLVRMIDSFMSRSKAEQALKSLLQKKKFGSVNPCELWQVYDEAAEGLPALMGTIMSSWTDQPGYPLVTVTVDHSGGTVTVQQERFLVEGVDAGSTMWWVPLTFTSGVKPNFTQTHPRLWLRPSAFTTVRLGLTIDSWLLFNIQRVGFYRVNYDEENWERLIQSLHSQPESIHELNRAQLLDDSLALSQSGRLPYSTSLHLLSYLVREGCYFPWAAVLPSINLLLTRFNGHPVQDAFTSFISGLVAPAYESVGFRQKSSDSHLTQLNRVQIVSLACSLALPACVLDAQHHEQQINQGKHSEVPPGLESVQLCTVLEAGVTTSHLHHNLTLWTQSDQVRAMPCVADKNLLVRYLKRSIQEDSATQWRAKLVEALTRLANINPVFTILVEQYQDILARYGAKNVADYFTLVGSFLSTRNQLSQIERLISEVSEEDVLVDEALLEVQRSLLHRLEWTNLNTPSIESWLNSYNREQINETPSSLVYCP